MALFDDLLGYPRAGEAVWTEILMSEILGRQLDSVESIEMLEAQIGKLLML